MYDLQIFKSSCSLHFDTHSIPFKNYRFFFLSCIAENTKGDVCSTVMHIVAFSIGITFRRQKVLVHYDPLEAVSHLWENWQVLPFRISSF